VKEQLRDYAESKERVAKKWKARSDQVESLAKEGLTDSTIATRLGVSSTTVRKLRIALGLKRGTSRE
jgi:DNA-binding NarL/FixJ family response regulator